jgi:hypothetical protein
MRIRLAERNSLGPPKTVLRTIEPADFRVPRYREDARPDPPKSETSPADNRRASGHMRTKKVPIPLVPN